MPNNIPDIYLQDIFDYKNGNKTQVSGKGGYLIISNNDKSFGLVELSDPPVMGIYFYSNTAITEITLQEDFDPINLVVGWNKIKIEQRTGQIYFNSIVVSDLNDLKWILIP